MVSCLASVKAVGSKSMYFLTNKDALYILSVIHIATQLSVTS